LGGGTLYRIDEGIFQALPYGPGEQAAFTGPDTRLVLRLDGSPVALTELGMSSSSTRATRNWASNITFGNGSHTLVAEWRFDGTVVQQSTAYITASG
jgi:hypothetical protein